MDHDALYRSIPTLADTNPNRRNVTTNKGWIKPGQILNPLGRPKGSRHTLEEAFLAGVASDFMRYGQSAIVKCRKKDPVQYCKMIASLMPKSLNVQAKVEKVASELTEDDIVGMVIEAVPELPAPPSEAIEP